MRRGSAFQCRRPDWVHQLSSSSSPSPSHGDWILLKSKLLYDWWFNSNQFFLATSACELTTSNFIFELNPCRCSPYVTSSLMRWCVCHLHFLLVLASAVILRSRGTHNHILLPQIRESLNLEG
jgi:hypothetical protein